MKRVIIKFGFILLPLLFSSTGLLAQIVAYEDSLVRIIRIKSFLITNPPPQYIVEIKNDRTISFYNKLPENFSEHQSELIGDWIVDSTTVLLENSDFIELVKTINEMDFESIDKIEKIKSENNIEVIITGVDSDKFIIEFTNQKVEFSIGRNNENYISDSAKTIRKIIDELEEKYKPRK